MPPIIYPEDGNRFILRNIMSSRIMGRQGALTLDLGCTSQFMCCTYALPVLQERRFLSEETSGSLWRYCGVKLATLSSSSWVWCRTCIPGARWRESCQVVAHQPNSSRLQVKVNPVPLCLRLIWSSETSTQRHKETGNVYDTCRRWASLGESNSRNCRSQSRSLYSCLQNFGTKRDYCYYC